MSASKELAIGMNKFPALRLKHSVLFALAWLALPTNASAAPLGQMLPTGQRITPEAVPGAVFQDLDPELANHADFRAGNAVTTVVSHDGKTLLVLTSGFNRLSAPDGKPDPEARAEYVFVYDISGGTPKKTQVVKVPDSDSGIVFAADDHAFYVSGGVDDVVHIFEKNGGGWREAGAPIALGHKAGLGLNMKPSAAGLDVSRDGTTLVVANRQNDSITLIRNRAVAAELDLRPGKTDARRRGVAGGEFPYWVAIKGNDTAYITSMRDREIVVVDIRDAAKPAVVRRIALHGVPTRSVLDAAQNRLYVAEDNTDTVAEIDTAKNKVVRIIAVSPVAKTRFRGAAPNSLTLSPDASTLYATLGGINAIAAVPLTHPGKPWFAPTGWYPNSVSAAGAMLYVVNGRSNTGPNPQGCTTTRDEANAAACEAQNHYVMQLSKAGLLSFPLPDAAARKALNTMVAANNGFSSPAGDKKLMAALRQRIKHVIYIVKENRTYDQVLGDLRPGNGDPSLTLFGEAITPNQHALARRFVTLDNFYDPGEVSGNGWPWSVSARETDYGVKTIALYYGDRGQSYDVEGTNRDINVGLATTQARRAANRQSPDDDDLLPGTADVGAPDATGGGKGRGHIWDAALKAGLSVRNYGFFVDLTRYSDKNPEPIPLERDPAKAGLVVAFPAAPALRQRTDPYFRGFDVRYPDFYREREWEREFASYVVHRNLPNLTLLRLMEDHMGNFGKAIDGVATPETQVADNDYAVGRVIEAVAKSPYRDSTLIFVVEDDAQDGADHVDAHRSIAFVAGPYVKQGAVVSARYSTVNMLRTIEDILGIEPMNVNDAHQPPMREIFDLSAKDWTFSATPSRALNATSLPIAKRQAELPFESAHPSAYWAEATKGYDWSAEDRIIAADFNAVLWRGLKPASPSSVRDDP